MLLALLTYFKCKGMEYTQDTYMMSKKNLLVYLRADVVLVGERMILNCKQRHPTAKTRIWLMSTSISDSCYRRCVSIHIAVGLCWYYAEQPPCTIYIQSILMAMLWPHRRYRLHSLSQKQMEYRRQTVIPMAL